MEIRYMIIKPILKKTAIIGAASLLVVAACGKKKSKASSSGSDTVEPNEDALVTLETGALQLAGEVTILKGKDAAATSLGMKEVSFKLADNRTVRLRMTNEAFEEVERAGEIMCFLSQTKFWEQANAGVYQAQVDENKCKREQDQGSGGGGGGGGQQGSSASAGQTPKLITVYVNSTREANKPLVANMRLIEDKAQYHVKVVVVEPPSDEAPAGIFDMRYTGWGDGQAMGSGFIRTKRTAGGTKFILETGSSENGGGRSGKSQGVAELEAIDEDTIVGYVNSDSSGSEEERQESYSSVGKARFDANFLNVDYTTSYNSPNGTGSNALKGCYDLNKYKTAIFRYDLLDASGAVVKRNSGFPIEFTSEGSVRHGWAGYHGMWLGENASASTGMEVNKVDWANGQKVSTPYTVFAAPGKLTKMTKSTTTLGALKGADLMYWDNGNNYVVKWDGTTLSKTAKQSWGDNGPEEEEASGAVTLNDWGTHLWVPSLNAGIQIPGGVTLTDGLSLGYHSQKIVSGSSEAPTCNLVCFSNCPKMTPALADFSQSSTPTMGPMSSNLYYSYTNSWGTTNQRNNLVTPFATYTWDSSVQNLKEGSTLFALPSGLSTDQKSQSQIQNVYSGALVCEEAMAAFTNKENKGPWELQNTLDTYYTFSAGPQTWNQFVSLKDKTTGNFVAFDAPLNLSYVHSTVNDWDGNTDTAIIGKSYRLDYAGPGQLHGIPWKMAKDVGHHMPLFSIRSGTKVGDYTIIAIDGEQRLAKAASEASCSAIPLEGGPAMPSVDDLPTIQHTALGDADSELRYVGGVATE
jgi:hypothetical protein